MSDENKPTNIHGCVSKPCPTCDENKPRGLTWQGIINTERKIAEGTLMKPRENQYEGEMVFEKSPDFAGMIQEMVDENNKLRAELEQVRKDYLKNDPLYDYIAHAERERDQLKAELEQAKEKLQIAREEHLTWTNIAGDKIEELRTHANLLAEQLNKNRKFLDEDIASLECNSRIRTMYEDEWDYAMLLRDEADSSLKAYEDFKKGEK